MKRAVLLEQLISSWIRLTAVLKNTRITQPHGMNYNEAIIMHILYTRYREDGVGLVSFKELAEETRMLKSLVNRTLKVLIEEGFVERSEGQDKRTTYIRPIPEHLDAYLAVHKRTLEMVNDIVRVVGRSDAAAFIRIADKIAAHDPLNTGSTAES